MKGKAQFHLICPEQDGGLPTPRPASEIRFPEETVINTEGRDVTAEFLLGADYALREAKKIRLYHRHPKRQKSLLRDKRDL